MSKKNLNFFICTYADCSAQYRRKYRLEIHLRTHTGERPFICAYDSCDKSYFRAQHLKRHELTHEQNNVHCTYEGCDMIFKTKVNLKRHVDNVHLKLKPKLYKCSRCDQQFNKHSWLKSHEYKHDSVKAYVCSEKDCGKRFSVAAKLKRHLKVHQGYRCTHSDCNVISATWSLHLKHLKVVHPTVHQCPICSKLFKSSTNMKVHCNTHSESGERQSMVCPEPKCHRSYFQKKNLLHHIKTVHEDRPFKCSYETCSLSFKDEMQLKRHFERAHDPDVPLSSKKRKLKAKRKKKAKLSFAAQLAGLTEEPDNNQTQTVIDNKDLCNSESSQIPNTPHINNNEASAIEVKISETESNKNICVTEKGVNPIAERNNDLLDSPVCITDALPIEQQNGNDNHHDCSSKTIIECF